MTSEEGLPRTLRFLERLDNLELTSRDTIFLVMITFMSVFFTEAADSSNPRKVKDDYLAHFRKADLSKELLEVLEQIMVDACERVEKLER